MTKQSKSDAQITENLREIVHGRVEELEGELMKELSDQNFEGDMKILKGKMQQAEGESGLQLQEINDRMEDKFDKTKRKIKKDFQQAFA